MSNDQTEGTEGIATVTELRARTTELVGDILAGNVAGDEAGAAAAQLVDDAKAATAAAKSSTTRKPRNRTARANAKADQDAEARALAAAEANAGDEQTSDEQTSDAPVVDAPAPVRATWKQHGNPKAFTFCGTQIKQPNVVVEIVDVRVDPQGLSLIDADGKIASGFGAATKFWAVVPVVEQPAGDAPASDDKPAKSTRTRKPATPKAESKFAGVEVDGYTIVKRTPGFDQLHADGKTDGVPAWLTRCNLHGKTTAAPNRKAGRGLGAAGERAIWCAGCKAAAAKAAAK